MCIAGEDIWHLDCERYKAAAGIRTGQWRRVIKLVGVVHCFVYFCSQIPTWVLKIPNLGLGHTASLHLLQLEHVCCNINIALLVIMWSQRLLIAADFGSRSRQSSTKMSRESSAGEPKVLYYIITFLCVVALNLSLYLTNQTDNLQFKGASS